MSTTTRESQPRAAAPAPPTHHIEARAGFPILIVKGPAARMSGSVARAVTRIIDALRERGFELIRADGIADAQDAVRGRPELSCVLIEPDRKRLPQAVSLIELIRASNDHLPVFVLADGLDVPELPLQRMDAVRGSIWSSEENPEFLAGHISRAIEAYARGSALHSSGTA